MVNLANVNSILSFLSSHYDKLDLRSPPVFGMSNDGQEGLILRINCANTQHLNLLPSTLS